MPLVIKNSAPRVALLPEGALPAGFAPHLRIWCVTVSLSSNLVVIGTQPLTWCGQQVLQSDCFHIHLRRLDQSSSSRLWVFWQYCCSLVKKEFGGQLLVSWTIADSGIYFRYQWDNPTSNLLAVVADVTLLIQGWDVLYWVVIILYRYCNKLPTNQNSRCIAETARTKMCKCAYYVIQTAQFLNDGPGSVRYTLHTNMSFIY